MTRKLKRSSAYELSLNISDDTFIATPRADQRQWLLNRLMKEAAEELAHADKIAPTFVTGTPANVAQERAHSALSDAEIMEDWQVPIMQQMAAAVARPGADVLEIGMGRGVSAAFVQQHNPASHTIIECNETITREFDAFKSQYPGRDIKMIESMWQDCLDQLDTYDGLLFHTYPNSSEEFVEQVVKSATFAEHFFDTAVSLLRPGGVLTYLTNEGDSLSRSHQRALLSRFSQFNTSLITDLPVPQDTRDSHWVSQMVMITATRA